MGQVTLYRAASGVFRRGVRASAYAVVTSRAADIAHLQQPIVTGNRSPQSPRLNETSSVAHHHECGWCRRADSLFCFVFHRLDGDCRCAVGFVFWGHVTPVRQHVTFTLHRRNAKKNLEGKSLRESTPSRGLSCNVAQFPAKFPQNPAVSDAVDSLIDCMMLNTNLTTQPHHWPAARASSRQAPHHHDAPLPATMDGGTR